MMETAFDRYLRVRDTAATHGRALARTHRACALVDARRQIGGVDLREPLRTIILNHVMQEHHVTTGCDEQALVVGEMYGYGFTIRNIADDRTNALRVSVTRGSVRVDNWGPRGSSGESYDALQEAEHVNRALLSVVLEAAGRLSRGARLAVHPCSSEVAIARERHVTVRQC